MAAETLVLAYRATEDHGLPTAAADRADEHLGVEIGTVDLLPILGRPAERLGGQVQLVADGLGQFVGKDPEVRRLADEPLILRQFDVADLAGLPVLLLSRRPKHLAADQSFTGIEFADHGVRPRLPAADPVLIEESGDINRAFSIAGDEFRTAHDPCGRLGVDLGPLLDRALMGDHRAAIRIRDGNHAIAHAGRLDVVSAAESVVHTALHLRLELGDECLVHRAENRQEERRLRIGAVETIAGSDDANARLGG